MNAATSRYVISATMGHLLICQGGTRFNFSHDFTNLLVTQLEAALDGKPIDFRLRINRYRKQRIVWRDAHCDDYLHRPEGNKFEKMCAYEMSMRYKKKYLSFKQMSALEMINLDENSDDEEQEAIADLDAMYSGKFFPFMKSHPGSQFSHLAELNCDVIPKLSLPEGKLCDIELLRLGEIDIDDDVKDIREDYAKMALIMFYPFRTVDDLKTDGSYWKQFQEQLDLHTENVHLEQKKKEKNHLDFWEKGFEILQNIQDRFTLERKLKRARDPINLQTTCRQREGSKDMQQCDQNNGPEIPDISQFCSEFE